MLDPFNLEPTAQPQNNSCFQRNLQKLQARVAIPREEFKGTLEL